MTMNLWKQNNNCKNGSGFKLINHFLVGNWRIIGQTNNAGKLFYRYDQSSDEDYIYQFKKNSVLNLFLGHKEDPTGKFIYNLFLNGIWKRKGKTIEVEIDNEIDLFEIYNLTFNLLVIKDLDDEDIIALTKIA